MRIVYLNSGVMPSKDANSVQIAKMCEAFAINGHDLDLIARARDEPADRIFEVYGVERRFRAQNIRLVGPRGTRTAIFLMRMLGRVRRMSRPDLVYGRDPVVLAAVAHLGIPMIYESHHMPLVGTVRFRLLKSLFRRCNFVRLVCTTTTTRDEIRRHFPELPADAVLTAPNAAAQPRRGGGELAAWPGRPGHMQVGFVGRPYPGKGIETIVAAASALADIDFHVVGADKADLSWVEATIPANLHFHGYQEHSILPAYYRRFDAAVAPYGAEVFNASGIESASVTSPLKVLEYMAAGLPIVTSALPGVSEVVDHERSGILVAPGDEQAFIGVIAKLRDEPELRQRLAVGAREHYLESHTVAARAAKVIEGLNG